MALYNEATSSSTVQYRVTNLKSGTVASGVITRSTGSELPLISQALGWQIWRTNNATARVVGIDIMSIYTETTY